MPKNGIQREEVLIGLSMLTQLFADSFNRDLAVTVEQLYRGQEKELLKAIVSAATLCLQQYAAETDLCETDVIEQVRSNILMGDTRLG